MAGEAEQSPYRDLLRSAVKPSAEDYLTCGGIKVAQQFKSISIEGLIGAGKTTFAQGLSEKLGPTTLVLWEKAQEHGNPYLIDFYKNKARWSFTLQVHQLVTRFKQHQLAQWWMMNGNGDVVMDRGYQGDTCFARMLNKRGEMDDREFETYTDTYRMLTAFVMIPNVCIHLVVNPEVALERIRRRQKEKECRSCESSVDIGYLNDLDREVGEMVGSLSMIGVNVLEVDWTKEDLRDRDEIIENTVEKIRSLPNAGFLGRHSRSM